MKSARYFFLTALFLTAGLIGGAASRGLFATSAAEASRTVNQGSNNEDAWEHCVVSQASYTGSVRGGGYWITYFTSSGFKVEDVEDRATRNAALALAFTKLGDNGWQMVDSGVLEIRGRKLDAYYFKRPKRYDADK